MDLIEACLNIVALTPLQRFNAVKTLNNDTSVDLQRYLIIAGAFLLITLLIVSLRKISKDKKQNLELFNEDAGQKNIYDEEREVLLQIARNAGLSQLSSIFTMLAAFETGSEKIKKRLYKQQRQDEVKQLEVMLLSLRTKLGFQKAASASFSHGTSEKESSRQIPVGKEVLLERVSKQGFESINAVVAKNTPSELGLQLSRATTIVFGESWKVKYFLGASIWEFEAFVISYDGSIMILSHSDDVKFVNRRRFIRTPVQKNAFVAQFPFEKTIKQSVTKADKNETYFPEVALEPLKFAPGVVTEMGGPGLRIETDLQVQAGERILVLFELESEKELKSVKNIETEQMNHIYTSSLRMVQNAGRVQEVGIVKRAAENSTCFTLGIELTGLRDADIDCLVRATNAASLDNEEMEQMAQINSSVIMKR